MLKTQLAVGDPAREHAGKVIRGSLVLAAVFLVMTWWSKETPALDLHQPWQDDPFDVVVSLDFAAVPLLVSIAVLRIQLCRRFADLPVRRLVDLLRVSEVTVAVCLGTEAVEWIAVLLRLHGDAWNDATTWQITALAIMTAAALLVGLLLIRASSSVQRIGRAASQPDWLADAVELGRRTSDRYSGCWKPGALSALQWIDGHMVPPVRHHPMRAAAILAGLLALPFVAAKALLEGYPPLLLVLSFALPAAGLFAMIVLFGRFLRIVPPTESGPTILARAVVAGCITGPMLFAFHDALLAHPSALGVNVLLFGGAAAGGTISAITQLAVRRLLPRRGPR